MYLGMEPMDAMHFWLWALKLWPLIPVAAFALFAWRTLRGRLAFFFFGLLVCFGVQFLLAQLFLLMPYPYPPDAAPAEQLLRIGLAATIRTLWVSLVVSLPALWWLQRVLSEAPNQPLNAITPKDGAPH
jgi:hypothetical protein